MREREKYSERVDEWTKEREWQSTPRAQLRLMVMKIRRQLTQGFICIPSSSLAFTPTPFCSIA